MPATERTPTSESEARRLTALFLELAREEAAGFGELLAGVPDAQLLGKSEFELRERAHHLAARFLGAALEERKKGGTKGRALPAPRAEATPT